jgi:magnesium-transporting ATPase (P-type)
LTVNVVAMFIVFFGSCVLKDSPLTAVQMLWVNLIMDTFAALALATEPPENGILTRKPQKKDAPIVSDVMWRNVHGHGIYQIIVLVIVLFYGQGLLCEIYDVRCEMENDVCKEGSLNAFYAVDLYYELETKAFWDLKKGNLKIKDFQEDSFALFNCDLLR